MAQSDAGKKDWPTQTFHTIQGNFYDHAERRAPKPCSRRSPSDDEPIGQQLSPPLVSKVQSISNVAAPLKPQALRNVEHDSKTAVKQVPLSNPQSIADVNKLYKTKNSLTISNPVIDSGEESHREIIPIIDNEIQENNPKPSDQMRSVPASDSLSASPSAVKPAAKRRDQLQPNSFVPSTEHGTQPENHYISEPSNAIASVPNELRSSPEIHIPSTDKSQYPRSSAFFDPMETQTLPPAIVAQLLAHRNEAMSNKCSHDQEPDDLTGQSRRSMSSYNDENNAKEISRNDKENLRNNNEPYIESHIENENALASVLNTEKNAPNPNKVHSLRILDKAKLPAHENSVSRVKPQFNEARREMMEPTQGAGVMGQSALMLMQSERICYACSTANNPSCWSPDRRTTVKYCRKGNNACITKTFGQGSKLYN